jgi:hypothetical protein
MEKTPEKTIDTDVEDTAPLNDSAKKELDSPDRPKEAINLATEEDPEDELNDNPYILSNTVSTGPNSFVDDRQEY